MVSSLRALSLSLLGALCALPAVAAAQSGSLEASVSRSTVEIGAPFTLTLVVQAPKGVDRLSFPSLEGLEELGRSRSSHVSYSFGGGAAGAQRVETYTLQLVATATGPATIGAASLETGGQRHQTAPIQIVVLPQGSQAQAAPPPPAQRRPNPFDIFDQDPFRGGDPFAELRGRRGEVLLSARVDKREAWVGEPITLTVEVLSEQIISGFSGFKLPEYDGFWSSDLNSPKEVTARRRSVNGRVYNSYLLRRIVLYPIRAGTLEVPPFEIEAQVGMGFFSRGQAISRKSRPLPIEVRPLPAKGQPPGFTSTNVGSWSVEISATPREVALGEPITVTLTAEGEGNVDALALPELPAIPGLRSYEPKRSQRARVRGGKRVGTKTVEWVLVPSRSGTFELPPLALHTFEPETGRYVTRQTEAQALRVIAAPGGAHAGGEGVPAGAASNRLEETSAGALALAPPLRRRAPPPYRRLPFLLVLFGAPLALALGLLMRRGRAIWAQRAGEAGRVARGHARGQLREAHRLRKEGQIPEAIAAIERSIVGYLAQRTGLPARGLGRDALSRALEEAGWGAGVCEATLSLLDGCEAARYRPGGPTEGQLDALLSRASKVISQWEEEPEPRP